MQAGAQGGDGDDQLGGVAEGGVEQAADPFAAALGQLLGGLAQPAGQGNDGDRCRDEDQQVLLWGQVFQNEGEGHTK